MKVIIIGSGFSSLSAAITLADKNIDVTVLEKNSLPGGRARIIKEKGFTFDMGPSWYWMPDVFEKFFGRFNKKPSDYYDLVRLDPSYSVHFGETDVVNVPAGSKELFNLFEKMEPGSTKNLTRFLDEAEYKYQVGMNNLVYRPGRSLIEFLNPKLIYDVIRLNIFESFSNYTDKFFKNKKIRQIIEFPILFLGALPENTPAMYSLMNHADLKLGTWYPMGGMYKIVDAMVSLAKEKGVRFEFNTNVKGLEIVNGIAKKAVTDKGEFVGDVIIAGADYHHVEQDLLETKLQSYNENYWEKRTMSPSSLIFYLGINKKLKNLKHHNLFFDTDFIKHAKEIYESPQWPEDPLFYVSAPSITDPSVAPEENENLFILIPVAPGLEDNETIREKYYEIVMNRLEKITDQNIRDSVIYKKSYAHNDFIADYNAFKGNAYGLANTLMQTAIFKPSLKSKKVKNLFFTGQLTVPGPGVPPALISGQVVADEIMKEYKKELIHA